MQKDFDQWNKVKKIIEKRRINFDYKEKQIWWCSVGINSGMESCGKGYMYRRPVLIIKKLSSKICIGIPLSRKIKQGSWFYNIKLNNEKICVLIYQIRIFDTKRFQRKLGEIDSRKFNEVKRKLDSLIEFSNYHRHKPDRRE